MDNQQTTLESLEAANGYCECPALSELTKRRKKASELEASCETFSSSLNLGHPQRRDRGKLLAYKRVAMVFRVAVNDYYTELNLQIKSGNLKLKPAYGETTINCSSCDQQIDIVD